MVYDVTTTRVKLRIISTIRIEKCVDLKKDDYIEEDLDTCVSKFASELPEVPLACMSLIGEDSNLLKNLLSPTGDVAINSDRKNNAPPSLEPGYTLSITERDNVVDQVAPIYNSIMRTRDRISNNEIKDEFSRWERILDSCLSEVLSDMEKWFFNHKETILGDLIEGEHPQRTPIILILDLEIQCVALESMPFLRSVDIYRMPSVISVSSTLQRSSCFIKEDGGFPVVDLSKTYYVLNPDEDLEDTQARHLPFFNKHQFKGLVKSFPSPRKFIEALVKNDMFIFDGHDSALQHVSTDKIRNMDRCPAAILTACTIGALELHGPYIPRGPVLHYIFAGSPAIASYLWVADALESDTMSKHILKTLTSKKGRRTIGTAVALARKECSLPYYEGARLICYGVPTRFIKTVNR
ncbi:separase isoform X1 [Tanacetum coccineum]